MAGGHSREHAVQAVFFDIGETLVDETRLWGLWADWLGVPRLTFFAALGAVIARGEDHRRVFDLFRPGLDVERATRERLEAGWPDDVLEPGDFYPDALPCLAELRRRGYVVGIAGNQPARAEAILRAAAVPADVIGGAGAWGVAKPSSAFFRRLVGAAAMPAGQVAYVGDRVDYDVVPAAEAGLVSVFLRRGPWGVLQAQLPDAARAHLRIDTLRALPDALDRHGCR